MQGAVTWRCGQRETAVPSPCGDFLSLGLSIKGIISSQESINSLGMQSEFDWPGSWSRRDPAPQGPWGAGSLRDPAPEAAGTATAAAAEALSAAASITRDPGGGPRGLDASQCQTQDLVASQNEAFALQPAR